MRAVQPKSQSEANNEGAYSRKKAIKLFGTDGIRGKANTDPMTADMALRLGQAAGLLFTRGEHRHHVVIGKDTRLSGYMIEPALTAGFIGVGMDVTLLGPLPTPAVAMLTRSLRADLGVMISASRNSYEGNGIRLFGPDGAKLSDEVEAEIEAMMDSDFAGRLADSASLGRAQRLDSAGGRYIETAKACFPRGARLDGMRIVIDCANGAAYRVAPTVLWELGATVIPVGVMPDGFNINKNCGSTEPEFLGKQVLEHQAHLGIALDGDADSVLIADETGKVVDGDQILALIARSWQTTGQLRGGGIAATVMSNLGLERFLASRGLVLYRVRVGDRYVMQQMRELGLNVGGEQSGHIILSDYAATGDGLLAALQVLAVLVQENCSAADACHVFKQLPQQLKNVRFGGPSPLGDPRVQRDIAAAEAMLSGAGRVLVRESGTESLIRVMAEGEDEGIVSHVVDGLCTSITEAARMTD